LALFRWGLIPAWASDLAIGNKLLNARCETVTELD
jgi:putative SOS response-associated peptidase YedK